MINYNKSSNCNDDAYRLLLCESIPAQKRVKKENEQKEKISMELYRKKKTYFNKRNNIRNMDYGTMENRRILYGIFRIFLFYIKIDKLRFSLCWLQ